MINTYTNIYKVRDYLKQNTTEASAITSDDALLMRFAKNASRAIDRYTRRKFYPRLETRFYDYKDTQVLRLDDDLAELVTLRTQNGACTVGSAVMWLGTGKSWNHPPYDRIVLDDSTGSTLNYSGTPQRANEVTGWWTYHETWGEYAWVDTGTSLQEDYTASAGSLNLAGAGSYGTGASDADGDYPRIAVGDIIKIGNQLFNVIGSGSQGNNIVPVKPYANGTSGTSATSGASIAKFRPEPDIEWCALRLTGWMYGQKDSPYTDKQAFPQLGVVSIPSSMPPDVRDKLDRFERITLTVYP